MSFIGESYGYQVEIFDNMLYLFLKHLLSKEIDDEIALVMMAKADKGRMR